MLGYAKLSIDSSLEITLSVQKYYLMPVNLCYLYHLLKIQLKK